MDAALEPVPRESHRQVLQFVAVLVLVLGPLGGVVWTVANHLDLEYDQTISALLTTALVGTSIVYAWFTWKGMLENRESDVRPMIMAELTRFGSRKSGVGIRFTNAGKGPALDIKVRVLQEPQEVSFRISGLGAVAAGFPSIVNGEARVLSTGQLWEQFRRLPDAMYVIEVRFLSLTGREYRRPFTLKAKHFDHVLVEELDAA